MPWPQSAASSAWWEVVLGQELTWLSCMRYRFPILRFSFCSCIACQHNRSGDMSDLVHEKQRIGSPDYCYHLQERYMGRSQIRSSCFVECA